MLTRQERMIVDCLEIFETVRPLGIRHVGFKGRRYRLRHPQGPQPGNQGLRDERAIQAASVIGQRLETKARWALKQLANIGRSYPRVEDRPEMVISRSTAA